MRRIRLLIFVLLTSNLIGCTSILPISTAQEVITKDETPSPTLDIKPPTSTLTPTLEFTSTTTPTSLPTVEPTITYTPSPTPFSFDGAVIDESNYTNLEKFHTLGKGSIQSQAVSEDGRFQIIKTVCGLYLYETETLEELAFFEDYGGFTLIPGKPEMVAITHDLTLAVINLETQSLTLELEPPDALFIGMIAFSRDASHMAVTVLQPHHTRLNWTSYRIDVWNLDNGELISQLESDLAGGCSQMAFSRDNSQLITECSPSGGGYPRLFHWDIQNKSLNWQVTNEFITNFPFSIDGSLVATYTLTQIVVPNQVIIRRTSDGSEVGRVNGQVSDNPFSPDKTHVVTSTKYDVMIWHVASSQRVKRISVEVNWPLVSYSDDGEYILANGGQIAWQASDFSLDESYPVPPESPEVISGDVWLKQGHLSNILGVELFEGGRLFVWGVRNHQSPWEEQTLWWWCPNQDAYTEISLGKDAGYPAFSPSKEQMAVCTQEGLKIITIEDGTVEDFGLCRSSSSPVVFSGDGKRLFMGSGIVINEFEIESHSVLSQLRGHDYNIGNIISSEDGKYLFSTSADEISGGRESIIWQLDPHTFTHKWYITAGSVSDFRDAVFTPDNANLVAIFGREVTVWRVLDGWYLANFEGNDVTFLADGKLGVVGLSEVTFLGDGDASLRNKLLDFYDTSNWRKISPVDDEISELPPIMMDFENIELFFTQALQGTGVMHLKAVNEGRVLISVTGADVIEFWRVP